MARRIALVGFSFLVASSFVQAADLPANLKDGIDKANEAFEKNMTAIKERMVKRFDAQDQAVRKNTQMKAVDRQAALDTLAAEKVRFEKYGLLPFSGLMRDDSMAYLKEVNAARLPALKAYDKGITHFQKGKNDTDAAALTTDMKATLRAKAVGVWVCSPSDKKKDLELHLSDNYTIWGDTKHSWSFSAEGFRTAIRGEDGGTANYVWKVGNKGDTALGDNKSPLTYKAVIPERRKQ